MALAQGVANSKKGLAIIEPGPLRMSGERLFRYQKDQYSNHDSDRADK